MDFSVVIPWRASGNPQRSAILSWIIRRYHLFFGKNLEILLVDSEDEPFSRSKSRNQGVEVARNDLILIADADTTPVLAIKQAFEHVSDKGGFSIPYKRYGALKEEPTRKLLDSYPGLGLNYLVRRDCEFVMESWAGLICIHREDFDYIGGYDERFVGWGFEDTAFHVKARTLLGEPFRTSERIYHLWHGATLEETWNQPYSRHNAELYEEYLAFDGNELGMLNYVREIT